MQAGLLFGLLVELGGELLVGALAKSMFQKLTGLTTFGADKALGFHSRLAVR
jgi:hypothetical protein